MVRGVRVTMPARKAKIDLLLVAARYDESGELKYAKGYEPVGQIWSDVLLMPRDELVARLRAGERVVHGEAEPLAQDFSRTGPIQLKGENGAERIAVAGAGAERDDLGVPLF